MQAVPARLLALGLALLIGAGTLALSVLRPGRAAAKELEISALVAQATGDQVEVRLAWRWNPPARDRGRSGRRQLLAISFDTQRLVFLSDDAPAGRGADGDLLERLEAVAGPDGARRLYTVPIGEDGTVTLRFRSVHPGVPTAGAPFRIHAVVGPPGGPVWVREVEATSL